MQQDRLAINTQKYEEINPTSPGDSIHVEEGGNNGTSIGRTQCEVGQVLGTVRAELGVGEGVCSDSETCMNCGGVLAAMLWRKKVGVKTRTGVIYQRWRPMTTWRCGSCDWVRPVTWDLPSLAP